MSININQFSQTSLPGQLDLKSGGLDTSFTLRIDPDSAATDILTGTGLVPVDGGANDTNGVPLCDVLSADTVTPFGALIHNSKKGSYQPGDIVQVSYDGCVQRMEAAGALARWATVALDVLNPGQVQASGTDATFGRTLDKATAAGDIIRILVKVSDSP